MKREEHGNVADLILVNGKLITVDPRYTITGRDLTSQSKQRM